MKILKYKKVTHNPKYNILLAEIDDNGKIRHVTYVVDKRTGSYSGMEVYSGRNYVLGSNSNSYSRFYKYNIPNKYKLLALRLKKEYVRRF